MKMSRICHWLTVLKCPQVILTPVEIFIKRKTLKEGRTERKKEKEKWRSNEEGNEEK